MTVPLASYAAATYLTTGFFLPRVPFREDAAVV
jgi:hypothetical protein